MATSVFTTWAALRDNLLDELARAVAAHEFRVSSKTNPAGETTSFKSIDQLRGEIERVTALATAEEDTQSRSRWTPIAIRRAF